MSLLISPSGSARQELYEKYAPVIETNSALNRSLVSYKANSNLPYYRWFKYKEGFSAGLVNYVLNNLAIEEGTLFDPFSGTGVALLAGKEQGLDSHGIELLPLGVAATRARLAAERVDQKSLHATMDAFEKGDWRLEGDRRRGFPHLRITRGAFSEQTEQDLTHFRTWLDTRVTDSNVRLLFETACLNILESVSYTRKDGQYLRWDGRAPRELRARQFNKGQIVPFATAMRKQLQIMREDMDGKTLFPETQEQYKGEVVVDQGSCLQKLPATPESAFDIVVTSPPYCNRYDYTRTYALELAYLGVDEPHLKGLRQELLSCTVENRSKVEALKQQYRESGSTKVFEDAITAFENQDALQEILEILDDKAKAGAMNNTNVPLMVRNYFLESAIVVFELARVMKSGGYIVMVNDNVQYAGEEVPVDLILCDLAAKAGFTTRHIWVLGRGKGNSSQQMGAHGRNELRKCAYVWQLN